VLQGKMAARLSVVASLLAGASAQTEQQCQLSHRAPRKARYLKFCQDYNSKACCIPGHDLENQVQFENVIDGLGPGCKNPMMYPELRYFYCLGCDPSQPYYTNTTTNEIYICDDFVTDFWRDPAFDDCGVMYPNACPSNWENEGMDPYTCGDDLLMPHSGPSWEGVVGTTPAGTDGNPTGIQFLNVFKPPGLDDFTFVVVPKTKSDCANPNPDSAYPCCWTAPAFQSGAARLAGSTGLAIMLVGMLIPAALQRLR